MPFRQVIALITGRRVVWGNPSTSSTDSSPCQICSEPWPKYWMNPGPDDQRASKPARAASALNPCGSKLSGSGREHARERSTERQELRIAVGAGDDQWRCVERRRRLQRQRRRHHRAQLVGGARRPATDRQLGQAVAVQVRQRFVGGGLDDVSVDERRRDQVRDVLPQKIARIQAGAARQQQVARARRSRRRGAGGRSP